MKNLFFFLVRRIFSWPGVGGAVWSLAGIGLGMALFVGHISRATSYLSDAPETCINCHVMTDAYLSWQHSSHARVATCNDCHVPHENLLGSYAFKARDGLWHATVFTLRWEPQVIRLSAKARPVVQANCRRCHQRLLEEVSGGTLAYAGDWAVLAKARDSGASAGQQQRPRLAPTDRFCWDCHRSTPHGLARSLASSPDVFRPRLPQPIRWVQEPTITDRPIREDGGGSGAR
jgi:cytochrome c nitrite reductase small subunit